MGVEVAQPDDLEFPHSLIARIVKNALPDSSATVVTKDASLAINRATSLFVMYLTDSAQEVAKSSKRSTIQGQHILQAMVECGFDNFAVLIKDEIHQRSSSSPMAE
eukprot:Filipodium_phascolosomae@DN2301_c0_g1_i13.p3